MFCCISWQVPEIDKDLCSRSMRILCMESDFFLFPNVEKNHERISGSISIILNRCKQWVGGRGGCPWMQSLPISKYPTFLHCSAVHGSGTKGERRIPPFLSQCPTPRETLPTHKHRRVCQLCWIRNRLLTLLFNKCSFWCLFLFMYLIVTVSPLRHAGSLIFFSAGESLVVECGT